MTTRKPPGSDPISPIANIAPELLDAAGLVEAGKLAKAEPILRSFVRDKPTDVNGIRLLADTMLGLGAHREAEDLLRRCVELAPDYTSARYGLATALFKRQRYAESLAQLEPLLKANPNEGAWLTLKAANLAASNEHERAIALYEHLIVEHPSNSRIRLSLGHALRTVGRVEEAIAAYEQCIAMDSGTGEACWSLANLKTYRFDDARVAAIELALKNEDCDYRDYYHLLFALGKAREDRKEYKQSLQAYAKGNQARCQEVRWDVQKFRRDTTELIKSFSTGFLETYTDVGCAAADPIFVVGLPRAGSTLIEQILASHSQVEGTTELEEIIGLAHSIAGNQRPGDQSRYPSALATMPPEKFAAMGEQYIAETRLHRTTDKPFFVDKMPNNFIHIGLIHLLLPQAKIIDARRDAMDCCFSCYKQLFASGQGFTYSLDRIGSYYKEYARLMDHWDTVLPGRVLRVCYEDLVVDFENQVRRLLDYCGLPFEEACLTFYNNERTIRTPSSEQVRQPLYQSGIGQWERYAEWLEPLRKALQ